MATYADENTVDLLSTSQLEIDPAQLNLSDEIQQAGPKVPMEIEEEENLCDEHAEESPNGKMQVEEEQWVDQLIQYSHADKIIP